MAMFHKTTWQEQAGDQLAHQLSRLTREVAAISHKVQRLSGETSHDAGVAAGHLVDEAWHQGELVARRLKKQAVRAGEAVKDDPVPAIVAVVGVLLLLNLLLGRKQ